VREGDDANLTLLSVVSPDFQVIVVEYQELWGAHEVRLVYPLRLWRSVCVRQLSRVVSSFVF